MEAAQNSATTPITGIRPAALAAARARVIRGAARLPFPSTPRRRNFSARRLRASRAALPAGRTDSTLRYSLQQWQHNGGSRQSNF